MIRLYKRYSLIWNTLAFVVVFWALVYLLPLDVMKEITYDASLLVMVGVFATWLPDIFHIYRKNDTRPSSMLILAMFLVSFVLLQSRALAVINYQLGNPQWVINSPWGSWIAAQAAIIGLLLMWAVLHTKGSLETAHRHSLIALVGLLAFVGGILFARFGPLAIFG